MVVDPKSGYFTDGVKKVHYVIAIKEEKLPLIDQFLRTINSIGLNTEIVRGTKTRLMFVLVHLPKQTIDKFATEYNVGLEEEKPIFKSIHLLSFLEFGKVILPYRDNEDFSSANRIIIVNKILETTAYNEGEYNYGITRLKKENIIVDSYPLHDGPLNLKFREFNSSTLSTCNDRELLYRYWANFRLWKSTIPLDLIKNYFGLEIAFYYRFVEYFNVMLVAVAILGVVIVITNIILLNTKTIYPVSEVCNSKDQYLCPNCNIKQFCHYVAISEYCGLAKWSYVFDNDLTIFFAILMSFWATFFLNLWRRRTNELKLRWDIEFEDIDPGIRREYAETVSTKVLNKISGEMEPRLPNLQIILRYTIMVLVCFLLILLYIGVIFVIFYFETWLKIYILSFPSVQLTRNERKGTVMITGSILLVVIIKLNARLIPKISLWLTNIEKPKTQKEFDISLQYKLFILSFFMNYSVLFYIAFVKGNLYQTPKDTSTMFIEKDTCQPLACILDLTSFVCFILIFRRFFRNIFIFFWYFIKNLYNIIFNIKKDKLPQYEEEYYLERTDRYFLISNYNEMIIEYGFITLFGAAFPLAPLITLFDNLLQMRLSAYQLVKHYRRPIPRRVPNIGIWEGVLLGLTYFSTAINAFVIAFTSQFVARHTFAKTHNGDLRGFLNYTLSEFATKDNDVYNTIDKKQNTCYYIGMREPPTSPDKYERTIESWEIFTWKLVFVVVFEHLVLMLNALLDYSIRDIPAMVREYIAYERQVLRESKVKLTPEQEQSLFLRYRR